MWSGLIQSSFIWVGYPAHPPQTHTSYTLWIQSYSLDKIFKFKVTTARSKDKSWSHQDTTHPQPMSLFPAKFQLPTLYGFWNDQSRFQTQGHYSKANGKIKVTPSHCTPAPLNQYPYQVSTSYTLRFLR